MKKKFQILFLFLFVGLSLCMAKKVSVVYPRVEMQENPLGIDLKNPHFSWQLASDVKDVKQMGYEIQLAADLRDLKRGDNLIWESGLVQSDKMQIEYEGLPMQSCEEYYWRVRVQTNHGMSSWSAIQRFSTGMLHAEDWHAKWIGENAMSNSGESQTELHTRLAARYLRKDFQASSHIDRATLYISGLGYYQAFLNGKSVSEDLLTPSITFYSETVYYNTYDVTDLLQEGDNALGVILGNGRYFWVRGSGMEGFGLPRLLAQLEIEYTDGSKKIIASDETWKVTSKGPIVANNEFDGEEYDMKKELPGWNLSGYDDSTWKNVDIMSVPCKRLLAQPSPSVAIMERIYPSSVTRLASGKVLIDMGQNMVGRLKASFKGKAGQKVVMRFAEIINPDSTLYVANLRSAKATDIFTPSVDGYFSWAPVFVYHGFRYVEIDGVEGDPDIKDFVGEVMYDRMQQTGHFETSDFIINQIFKNAYWGIRGNYHNMPTDCPQRDERHGWLGDRATGCWGESFVFDNALLYRKWLQDIEESQREDGVISAVSPRFWTIYAGDVTWPSVYILAAEMLYRHYGDVTAIVKHYDSMKRWVEYIYKNSMKDGLVVRDEWGDWCMPPEAPELIHSQDPMRKTDGAILGSTTFYGLLYKMIDFARISGHAEDIDNYKTHAEALKKAYNKRFFNYETAQYGNNSVTGNLLSLRYGLVPDGYEKRVFSNVVEKTEKDCKGHVSTGVVGIQHLMRGLTEHGREDLAYKIVTNTDYPSWGYMIEKGATTIWELWNGDTAAPDMNSANHVMLLGDLLIWYYENLAGIKNSKESVGFRHIEMKPCFPDGLDYVNASYQSVSGKIVSNWTRTEGRFSWNVTIPANCSATLYIPLSLHPEKPEMAKAHSIQCEGDNWIIELGSGNYCFKSDM